MTAAGVVVAVCGKEPEDDRGKFHVEALCFQELPSQIPRPPMEQDKYVWPAHVWSQL